MEDIFIGESEMFEDVRACAAKCDFPAVKFFRNESCLAMYFNRLALEMIGNADRAHVMISSRFIVFLPSSSIDHNKICRRTYKNHAYDAYISVSGLRGRVPEKVWFKCYPYKGGIAIKRDEPIMQAKGEV